MSESSEILTRVDGPVLNVVLNRPTKRNAMTFAMYDDLADLLGGLDPDGPIKVVTITGAGSQAFASGTDISLFRGFSSGEDGLKYEVRVERSLGAVEACPVPTVAAISGACTGGGAVIAACCDLRLATSDMTFGFPIARTLGNCLSTNTLGRLVPLIGEARTKDMLMTCRLMGAEEALAIGLVRELYDDTSALLKAASELALQLARHAPLTLRATKDALLRMRSAAAEIDDDDLIALCYGSADFREGLDAFLAKRAPEWKGC